MKHSDASKLATETVDKMENIPGVTKRDLDHMRGAFSVRERLRAKILQVLWGEFGPFDDQLDD